MKSLMTRILVSALVATSLVIASTAQQSPALAQATINTDIVELGLIDAVYQDFLGRSATQAELDHFAPRLGIGQVENNMRARVLASRAFFVEVGGSNRDGFVRSVYRAVLDRAPTSNELAAGKRQLARSNKSHRKARRVLANQLLARASYDPDEIAVREIVLQENDANEIVRFDFEIDEAFEKTDNIAATVSINGNMIDGKVRLRAGKSVVSFVPDNQVARRGTIVGMVFLEKGGVVRLADIKAPANNLPPRTPQPSPWPSSVFDDQRIVAYYGNHLTPLLGVLGETGPEAAVSRVQTAAARFDAPDKPGVGAFEMIVTVAQRSAGLDGNYSHPSKLEDVERWIDVAAANGLHVILDIQPGRSHFLPESQRYESLLKRPNVHLALDPEWRMEAWQRPGQTVGSVTAAEINEVSAWLSDLVLENDLPEKMFILHQFQTRMIKNRDDVIDRPGLATVIHADGFGGRAIKQATYSIIKVDAPFYNGFKLFIDEDTNIYQPSEVLQFSPNPVPDLITYQ